MIDVLLLFYSLFPKNEIRFSGSMFLPVTHSDTVRPATVQHRSPTSPSRYNCGQHSNWLLCWGC